MSAFDGEEGKREIIIVKRGGGDHEDGHHGGAWKIAFADFMTAMMCFFLVMWLVNAANEETKAAIASYFNPMTLVDNVPSSKGLDDPGESPQSTEQSDSEAEKAAENATNTMDQRSGPGQHANSLDQAETEKTSDQHLFSDPYAVLAEIAAQTATLQNISAKGDGGVQTSGPATGAQGGESYRDPFAPDFWSQEVANTDDEELDVFRNPRSGQTDEETAADPAETAPEAPAVAESEIAVVEKTEQATEPPARETAVENSDAQPETEVPVTEQTAPLAERIREEITEAFGANSELNKTISVTAQADGILISVTDELNYGMFEVGSAVPQGELVLAMEKIAETLNEHTGGIHINGHTDGRPFRSADYDNWRLSSARAHAAYYMLVRGGLDEARVKEVAGFADRQLKIKEDPLADANRRIEIFLETAG